SPQNRVQHQQVIDASTLADVETYQGCQQNQRGKPKFGELEEESDPVALLTSGGCGDRGGGGLHQCSSWRRASVAKESPAAALPRQFPGRRLRVGSPALAERHHSGLSQTTS